MTAKRKQEPTGKPPAAKLVIDELELKRETIQDLTVEQAEKAKGGMVKGLSASVCMECPKTGTCS
jgi:hypothetical protein